MTTQTRSEAQTRADDIRVFRRELERLEHAGLLALSDSQRQAIAAYQDELLAGYVRTYDIDCDVKGKQLSLGMRTASFLGALALAASVFFLFYQFWGWFSTAEQVATLLLAHWGDGSYLQIDREVLEGFYQLFGFAASAGAIWLGTRRNWGEVFNTGVVFFVIFLYTKFYDWWWEIMPKYLFFLVVGLTAVLLLLILKRLRVAARHPHEENRP